MVVGGALPPPPTFLSRQINREDRVGGEGRKELRSLPSTHNLILHVKGKLKSILSVKKCWALQSAPLL